MRTKIIQYFTATALTSYESEQRRRTLYVILSAAMIAMFALGWVNVTLDAMEAATVLFIASGLCILGMELTRRGLYLPASVLLVVLILGAIHFNMVDGNGLHDPGVVSYPIFIIIGGLLFDKRVIPLFTLMGIGSLAHVTYLEISGALVTVYPADLDDFITIAILLVSTAVVIWVIMGNSDKNLERIKRSEEEILEAYDLTLEGWAKALEYRDAETEGHSRRVTDLSLGLAKELGCGEEEIAHILRGALLHDIGKMAIPDEILFKPGPLDDEERAVIEKHPIYAKEMLEDIPFLLPAIRIPYNHHERWDGKGYPEGLKGEEIPLSARIFTVIDHWDSLRSDRPYRKAWPREKVVRYIQENTGKIYEPRIVEAFFRVVGVRGD